MVERYCMKVEKGIGHTLAGALDAAAGALEACEAGALEAVADLGAIVVCWLGD
jgi:hypothetical protein